MGERNWERWRNGENVRKAERERCRNGDNVGKEKIWRNGWNVRKEERKMEKWRECEKGREEDE